MLKNVLYLTLLGLTLTLAAPNPGSAAGPAGPGTTELDAGKYASFAVAATSPETVGKTLVVATIMPVDTVTVAGKRSLKILPGGRLVVPAGKVLSIEGPFAADLSEVFELQGSGRVRFGESSVSQVHAVWFGPFRDGSRQPETTLALQHAIDACPPGGELILDPGIYRVGDLSISRPLTLRFLGRIDLTNSITLANIKGTVRLLDPNLTQNVATPPYKIAIEADSGGALEIIGGTLAGVRRAIRTQNFGRVVISGVTVKLDGDPGKTGTAIQVRNAPEGVEITGCDLTLPDTSAAKTNAHSGISVNFGRNVRIADNRINLGYSGIVVRESDSNPAALSSDVVISGNTLVGQRVADGKPAQGIYVQKTDRLKIADNRIDDFGYSGIAVAYPTSRDVQITGNRVHTLDKIAKFGILASRLAGGVISGNTVTGTPMFGIQASDGKDVVVQGNTVEIAERKSSRAIVLAGLEGGAVQNNRGAAGIAIRITGLTSHVTIGPNNIVASTALVDDSTGSGNEFHP